MARPVTGSGRAGPARSVGQLYSASTTPSATLRASCSSCPPSVSWPAASRPLPSRPCGAVSSWTRSPPRPSFPHPEYDATEPPAAPVPPPPPGDMVTRTFVFGPGDVAAIKARLPPHLPDTATTFEAVAAALWRARTAAMEVPPGEDARLVVVVGVRGVRELGLPAGYYGNACVFPAAVAAAGALRQGSLGDAVELVRAVKKKAAVSAEYVRSTADLLVRRGRPRLARRENLLILSDNRHAGYLGVDVGWGEPVYAGPSDARFGVSFLVAVRNAVAVPVMLPRPAMDRFVSEMNTLLQGEFGLTVLTPCAARSGAMPTSDR
ncbi:hypothetical protein EJB05_43484, partial [Eragrostis curvula]